MCDWRRLLRALTHSAVGARGTQVVGRSLDMIRIAPVSSPRAKAPPEPTASRRPPSVNKHVPAMLAPALVICSVGAR
jgi:hypothetical protein